jgi:hypothetical protein
MKLIQRMFCFIVFTFSSDIFATSKAIDIDGSDLCRLLSRISSSSNFEILILILIMFGLKNKKK